MATDDKSMTSTRFAGLLQRGLLQRGLRWWGRELKGVLALPPFHLLFGNDDRVILDLETGRVSMTKCHAGIDSDIGVFPAGEGLPREAVHALASQVRRGTEAVIRLPRGQLLCRDLTLPLEAEGNLHEVLGYEMDRHTPFRADQVYFDHHVIERLPSERRMRVQLLAAPQGPLAPVVQTLKSLGLVPCMITVAEQGARQCEIATINLLPEALRGRPGGIWGRANRILLLSALVLGVAAAAIPLQRQQALIEDMESRLTALRQDVEAARAMQASTQSMREELGLFLEQRRQSPVVIDVLEEVSRLLPDDTWLMRFDLKGRRMNLQGITADAPALIGLLEDSPMLEHVVFSAPVVRDPRFNRYQFNIEADVTGGRGG